MSWPDYHMANNVFAEITGIPTSLDPISFAEFLQSSPPDAEREVVDWTTQHSRGAGTYSLYINQAKLQLHCDNCEGIRTFDKANGWISVEEDAPHLVFLTYSCLNCIGDTGPSRKTFAVMIGGKRTLGLARKLGEHPPFGEPIPARVFQTLIGEDYRELFLKGRRAENRSLGIGAYAYYRRIAEDQRGKILGEVIRVAKKLGEPEETLKIIEAARTEQQFQKSMEIAKPVIPKSLLINGHNPMALLHDALSEGIHKLSDEECLSRAEVIRLVLFTLAERSALVLKDEAALQKALSGLLSKKQK